MIGWWLAHPGVVVWTVALTVLVVAVLVLFALDFDLNPHDETLEWPRIRPGDFPRHVIIHFGPPKPYDWGTDPDYAHLHNQEEI